MSFLQGEVHGRTHQAGISAARSKARSLFREPKFSALTSTMMTKAKRDEVSSAIIQPPAKTRYKKRRRKSCVLLDLVAELNDDVPKFWLSIVIEDYYCTV